LPIDGLDSCDDKTDGGAWFLRRKAFTTTKLEVRTISSDEIDADGNRKKKSGQFS